MLKEGDYFPDELLFSIPEIEKARVLDVASGVSGKFWKAHESVLAVKMDNYSDAVERFSQNSIATDIFFKPGMIIEIPDQILAADARNFPFGNETFDVVTMGYLLDLLSPEEQSQAISEAYRVLRSGGTLVGDVVLTRWRSSYGKEWFSLDQRKKRSRILKLLDEMGFAKQAGNYRRKILELKFDMAKEGIGHTRHTKEEWLAYYFVAKKPDES